MSYIELKSIVAMLNIPEPKQNNMACFLFLATSSWADTTFWTYNGMKVETTGSPYSYSDSHGNHYYFPFYNIRDGATSTYYRTSTTEPVINITMQHVLYVDHIRIFPHCDE